MRTEDFVVLRSGTASVGNYFRNLEEAKLQFRFCVISGDVAQRLLVVSYRRFGTTYRYRLQGPNH